MNALGNPQLPYFAYPPIFLPYDPDLVIAHWALPKDGMVPHLHVDAQIHSPFHPNSWRRIYVEGPEKYGNCGIKDGKLLPGPCPPKILNISIENFLLDGLFRSDK